MRHIAVAVASRTPGEPRQRHIARSALQLTADRVRATRSGIQNIVDGEGMNQQTVLVPEPGEQRRHVRTHRRVTRPVRSERPRRLLLCSPIDPVGVVRLIAD